METRLKIHLIIQFRIERLDYKPFKKYIVYPDEKLFEFCDVLLAFVLLQKSVC
jgi:hypothetical protein